MCPALGQELRLARHAEAPRPCCRAAGLARPGHRRDAVGTGLNARRRGSRGRGTSALTGITNSAPNKFHAHRRMPCLRAWCLKALAANLMKIASDVRWMASGPNCGLGEISIPENEPDPHHAGQSKPHAMRGADDGGGGDGNDAAIGIAASQGNFELTFTSQWPFTTFTEHTPAGGRDGFL